MVLGGGMRHRPRKNPFNFGADPHKGADVGILILRGLLDRDGVYSSECQ